MLLRISPNKEICIYIKSLILFEFVITSFIHYLIYARYFLAIIIPKEKIFSYNDYIDNTDPDINVEDLPISIKYDEESEHLDVFLKYDSDVSAKSIFYAVLSQLSQDVKYITLNLVDEVSTSMFADSEEKDISEISNIKELTIILDATITDENQLNKYLKELLEEFSCLNITELILNGVSDGFIVEIFSDVNYKSISNLQFLRIENTKKIQDFMDFEIKNNISKMVR